MLFMDRETITHYGWIIVVSIIVATIMALATPFGELVATSVVNVAKSQTGQLDDAYSKDQMESIKEDLFFEFDTTNLLDAGLYVHGETNIIMTWDELIEKGYITYQSDSKSITKGAKAEYLSGDLIISNNVEIIDGAFLNCMKLNLVRLGSNVVKINENSFKGCRSLIGFIANTKLETISDNAFNGCVNLKMFAFGTSVTSFSDTALNGCTSLENILYAGTKSEFQEILGTITVPDNVKSIICNDEKIKL